MALVPYLLNDPFYDWNVGRRPASLFDQNFGLGIVNDDLMHPIQSPVPLLSGYIRPWRHVMSRESGISNIENTKESFKVNLDVQQFKPEEVTVKMADNYIVVEGKHEERQDEHGFITRQFQRRYRIPDDVDPIAVSSKLSSDGVLTIEAPKKALPPSSGNERVVSITLTNAPAIKRTISQEVSKTETARKE